MVTPSKLTPVSRFVAAFGMLPSSYKEAMTYEEQILWLCNFLETEVIPAINNNADGLIELQGLFTELKNYVDNYFENLDVQEEINNKLDAMVESGELQEIIIEYLRINGVLGFDTVAAMKAGTNYIDGSIAKTLGKLEYNDGEGAFYKIRDLKNTDVIDEVHIIALTNFNDLIAELIPDKAIEDIQGDISDINQAIDNITNDIGAINERLNADITIFIGDSYGSSDMPNNWVNEYCSQNGLTLDTNAFNYCTGSAGFYDINGGDNTYLHQIQNIDETIDKTLVTKIIVAGGWNDRVKNAAELKINVQTFANYVKANFPNAKLYVGMIANYGGLDPTMGGSINYRDWLNNQILAGYKSVIEFGGYYLNGTEEVMHIYSNFSSDMVHPNQNGCKQLAKAIKMAQHSYYHHTGYAEVALTPSTITKDSAISSLNINIVGQITNGSLFLKTTGNAYLSSYKLVNASDDYFIIKLGTYTTSLELLRHVNNLSSIPVTIKATFFQGGATEHPIYQGMLYFRQNGDIELAMNNNYNQTKYISSFSILTSPYALPLLSQ